MAHTFARGTENTHRVARPTAPELADLASMSVGAMIERLLVPQHAALVSAAASLRTTSQRLSRDPDGPGVLRRVSTVVEDLAAAMHDHFEREERAMFPAMGTGRTPVHASVTFHEHHEALATRMRWLQLLAVEVRHDVGINLGTTALFAGMAALSRLVHRHRELEQWVVLTRRP